MRHGKLFLVGALMLLASSVTFAKDTYPSRPIKIVVGYGPGGSTDIIARLIANKLGAELKQPVIVENRPGAGGNIGGEIVAHSAPDGYTLLMAATAQIVINPSLYKNMTYQPAKDLTSIMLLQNEHNMMVVTPSIPATTLKEFIAYAKANPTKVTFASPGVGSPAHLAGELLNQMAGLTMLHVPYKGTGAAVVDLVAGHVTMTIDNMPALLPQVKAGKLRAIAVASAHRATSAPNVPTMEEAGLPNYVISAWKGLMAPAATPRPVIEKLNASLQKIIAMPDIRKQMIDMGAEPAGGTPEQFDELIKRETVKWAALVKSTGVSLN